MIAPAERQAYLDQACAGNQALRQEVESLLSAFERSGDFFSQKRELDRSDFLAERPGVMIGRYKLLEKIGEGGFGDVWMAEQEEPVRRRVALKIIKVGMDTKEVVARFEAERQALAMMNHPNIARVFDGGATDSGRPYFVMELVRGVPITKYCDGNQLPTPDRLRLFIQVCDAVQHAHQKGIIHRDLKPTNILVAVIDDRPVPKVIDFGVAKATEARLTDKTLFTHFHQLLGTPAYMSPEQAGLGLDIDTRCDIYSLGVLLYELLTGVTPFDTQTLAKAAIDEARRIIREVDPPAPSTRLKTLGPGLTEVAHSRQTEPAVLPELLRGDLDCIVMSCLDKDRTRRYQTAVSLAQDVQRHLNREPVEARPATHLYRVQKFVQRNKLAVTSAGMITAALVLGLAMSSWLFVREREARRRAVAAEKAQNELRQKAEAGELSARALQFWNEGNLAEAEAANRQSLELWRKLLGPEHPQVATCLETLAAIVRDQGHLDEALRLYGEALKLNRAGGEDLRKLNDALALGTYDGVGALLNQQLPQARARGQLLELLRERGLSAARQGRWREAAAEYARLSELNPADAETGHALASLLVYTGDEAGYQRHCSRLLTQFGKTTDPVLVQAVIRDCLLLPRPATNLATIAPLAADLSQASSNHWAAAYFALAQGANSYRNGKFSEAIAFLQPLAKANKSAEQDSQASLFRAMAQHRLGLPKEAKETLAGAIQLIGTRLQRIEDGILGENWSEWIRAQVLLREARLMIED